jgi:hypothetical protein
MSWNLIPLAWKILTSKFGIAVIVFGLGFWKGYAFKDHRSEIADLQAQVATLKIDMSIARYSEEVVAAQADDLQESLTSNKAKADALIADLSKRAGRDVCRIGPSDRRKLSDIK